MVKKFTFLYLIFYILIGFTIVSCSKEEALPITADFQVNYLDNNHPVFGKVTQGMDIVDLIAKVKTDRYDKPKEDISIIKATVIQNSE